MNEQMLRFRVGMFVLGTLILLATLSILFSSSHTLFKSYDRYDLVFAEAPGVGPGTPVRRSGVHIGEVKDVELNEETGKVRVLALVERRHILRKSDKPTIAHGVLGGDVSIDFVPPRPDSKPSDDAVVAAGSEIQGTVAPDLVGFLEQAKDLVPSTQESLEGMRKSMQRYEQMAPQVEGAVREIRDLARVSREMVPELRRTNDEIRELAKSTREIVPEFRRTNQEIQVTAQNWGRLGERMDNVIQTNQDKLVKAIDNFNETVLRVGRVFNDENQRHLSNTLKNVSESSNRLDSITQSTDAMLKESRQTISRINDSLIKTNEVLINLQKTTQPLAEHTESVMKNLDESTVKLNRLLGESEELLRALNQGEGTLRKFITDPALYNNLNEVACQAAHLMPRMDRILHDIEVFSDKIARHPESLGLGGVVTPSSGLKDAPPSYPANFHPH